MKKFITVAALLAAGTAFSNAATETTVYQPLADDASAWTLNVLRPATGDTTDRSPSIADGLPAPAIGLEALRPILSGKRSR